MKKVAFIVFGFLIYSSSGVFCKLASQHDFASTMYLFYFSIAILVLCLFAVIWQKILSFMPLNKAFLCKSMCVIISLLYAHYIFAEEITFNNIIGTGLILTGLMVLSSQKAET